MPIRIATIGRQRTVTGIAKAVFDVKGPEALARAEAALIRANPQLADEGGIRPGGRIIVPPVRELRPAAPEAAETADAKADDQPILVLARERAQAMEKLAGEPLEQVIASAKEGLKQLRSQQTVDAILKQRPDLRENLEEIQKGAQEETERLAKDAGLLRETIGRALADLPAGTDRIT
ncbi:hypothetical protein ACFB49_00430 [Sphingomonas sp. DBB INV C78]|uniref:hypothetical protein n=1 Tax=Sphingomonas sp. DBB INV C78 TaxID=3349434 RepID=UPI0036D36D1F